MIPDVVADPVFSSVAVCPGTCCLCHFEFAEAMESDGTIDIVTLEDGTVLHSRCFLAIYTNDPSDYEYLNEIEDDGADEGINLDHDDVIDVIEDMEGLEVDRELNL